jgi:NAD(P)-dependent dehydrogenase (short-subunit alcohol dehydrogenase family)
MPVALITGGGGGIGRATALKLVASGHAVALAGRSPGPLEAAADEIRRAGGEARIFPTDVAKADHVETLVRKTLEEFGEIDVLVNAAGYAPMIPTPDVTPEQWRQILDVNLSSAFYTARAVWPVMRRQHEEFLAEFHTEFPDKPLERSVNTGGVIVNISSAAARDPFPGLGAYACAKLALNMLTQVLAREGEPLGIRVFGVAPSGVETAMFRQLLSPEQVPSEEILRPDDVADLIQQAVDGALRNSSGETIYLHRRI